jgi:hypothetical protein
MYVTLSAATCPPLLLSYGGREGLGVEVKKFYLPHPEILQSLCSFRMTFEVKFFQRRRGSVSMRGGFSPLSFP